MAGKRTKDLTRVGKRVRTQRKNANSPLWRKKAHGVWSKIVRRGGVCEVCGVSAKEKTLDANHLLPRGKGYPAFEFTPKNGMALCKLCHKYGGYSFHGHPIWFSDWLRSNRPELHAWIMERIHNHRPLQITYREAYLRLCRIAEQLGVQIGKKGKG